MSIPVHCKRCGLRFVSSIFGGSGTLITSGVSEMCPRCGDFVKIPDGTYVVAKNLLQAFYEEGEDIDQVKILKRLAEMAQSGSFSEKDFISVEDQLSHNFKKVWDFANKNGGVLGVLLATITLLLAIYQVANSSSDSASNQASADRHYQVERQILEELQKMHEASESPSSLVFQGQVQKQKRLQRRQGEVRRNRHERRKSSSISRKSDKSLQNPSVNQLLKTKEVIMEFKGNIFEDTLVQIDGNSFIDCTFKKGVVFEFGGGPVTFTGCFFEVMPGFALTGNLAGGIEALRKFHHLAGPSAVKSLVESFNAMLRKGSTLTNPTIN